jgi:nitrite reductase/ring-hydroxylating ferredoxin subunit
MAARERVIGLSAALVDGGPGLRFTVGRDGSVSAFAIRYRGTVHAYVNSCAHQEVELDWLPGLFFDTEGAHLVCAMHGARYAPDTGLCVEGPCRGANLVRITVRERSEDVSIVLSDEPLSGCALARTRGPIAGRGDSG